MPFRSGYIMYFSRIFTLLLQSKKASLTKSLLAGIYLLKVKNRNTKTRYEIYLKLTIKTPERRHWPAGLILCKSSNKFAPK